MKFIKFILCTLFILLFFCSCGKSKVTNATTAAPTTTEVTSEISTTTIPDTTAKQSSAAKTTAKQTAAATEAASEGAKYGDSKLLLDTNNRYVDAVVEKYGIERDGLVTAYSVKGGDNNYVWQFDGSQDGNGKYIRTAATLKYVYQVSQDLTIVYRTGGYTDNDGFTKREGLTVFMLTQQVLLPHLQDQINAE